MYGPYIIEQNSDITGSNPQSHVSYPRQASAPPSYSPNNLSPEAATQRVAHYLQTDSPQLHQSLEDQNDSGHPSLENSASTNGTAPPSTQHSPSSQVPDQRKLSDGEGVLKANPFIVNGIARAPHRVILEPIAHPIRDVGYVPKHLFAAKK